MNWHQQNTWEAWGKGCLLFGGVHGKGVGWLVRGVILKN